MKICHSLLITYVIVTFPGIALAQTWEYLTPIKSYTQIKGCSFFDANRGVAVSYIDDAIIMTLDGGDSWQSLAGPPTVGTPMDIEWVTEDLFIIAASNGDLFRTVDGGVSWQNMNPPVTDWLYNIDFINATTGFVTGNNGVLLKTSDSGLTWTLIPTGTSNRIVDVDFYDELNGCAAAWNGTLLRTTDGGNSWNIIPVPTTTSLQSIQFVDANTGFTVGGEILKTTDGGITWSSVYSSSLFFYLVHVNPNGVGYAVGAAGAFVKTSNFGATWQVQPTLGTGNIFCGDHVATGEAYLFGEKNIHKSFNGGSTWTVIKNEAPGGDFNDIQFTSDNSGWCVASALGGNNNGGIAQTTDGGRTWSIRQTASSGGWYAVDFPTPQTGYALGTSLLAKTTNGGQNWSYTTPFTLSGKCLHFRNAQTGFAGGLGSGSNICKTINGANSFTCGNNIGAAAIYFINDQKGIAIRNITGSDTYYKTFDGGNTWEYHNGLLGNCIEFFGEQKGWVGGYSGVYRTTDGGDTWEFVFVGSNLFLEVRFFDENTGYCVSDEGLIFRTTNGGVSWEYAFPNEEIFLGTLCAEITENYCYIGTAWGGVYRTSLGCLGNDPYPCVVSCPNTILTTSSACGELAFNLNQNNQNEVTWSFGDGSSEVSAVTASHTYSQNGEYIVSAQYYNAICDSVTLYDTIAVNCLYNNCPSGIIAISSACDTYTFELQGADDGLVTWNFGEGDTASSNTIVEHVFPGNGLYVITAEYNGPSCPQTWTNAYTVAVSCPVCPTAIEISSVSCANYSLALPVAPPGSVEWNFGDGSPNVIGNSVSHNYTENGEYLVIATLSGMACPLYTFIDTITVNCLYNNCPSGIIVTSSSCDTYAFELAGGEDGEVTWSFGDGDTASSNTIIEHVFPGNGLYVITAEYNGPSCPQPWTNVYTVAVSCEECDAHFTVTETSENGLILLENTSSYSGDAVFEFDFANGGMDLGNGWVQYDEDGNYTICLLLSTPACTDVYCDTLTIQGLVPVCMDNPLLVVTTLENPGVNDSVRIVIIDTDTTWYSGEWHQPALQGDSVDICLPDGCFEITMMSQSGLSAAWAEGQILPVSGASVSNGIIHLDSGGMIAATYVGVNIECAVGLSELPEMVFKSFPNPASTFTIESSEIVAEVYIYNSDGRQVMSHRPNCDRFNCDLSLYPPGIYALHLLTASGKSRCVFQVVE